MLRSRLGHVKDLSIPFACQDGDCGCMSAEQCWKSCCCRTREQNIAWAKAHNVEIPDYVLAATSKVKQQEKLCCSKPASTKSCCATPSAKGDCCSSKTSCSSGAGSKQACCDLANEKTAKSCDAAESKSCCQKTDTVRNENGKSGKRWKWVNGLSAAKCHGVAFDWMLAGLCDVPPVECYLFRAFQTGWVTSSPAIFFTIEESPAIPPPRALCPAFLA